MKNNKETETFLRMSRISKNQKKRS